VFPSDLLPRSPSMDVYSSSVAIEHPAMPIAQINVDEMEG
jgi:hypothetical protein